MTSDGENQNLSCSPRESSIIKELQNLYDFYLLKQAVITRPELNSSNSLLFVLTVLMDQITETSFYYKAWSRAAKTKK